MWTRAAVALRNINICEMPSHDDYLGAGRRAGCGRARLTTASPSQCARAGLQPFGQGVRGSRVPGLGPLSCFMGARPGCPWQGSVGIEGQVLRSSLNMANRRRAALCPAFTRSRDVVYVSLASCSRADYLRAVPVRPRVPSGLGERRGVGPQSAFP